MLTAALDLLAETGSIDAVSIEGIAARAKSGKTTIYRRWKDKHELIIAALATTRPPPPTLTGTSIRDDLILLLTTTGGGDLRHARSVLAVAMAGERAPQIVEQFIKDVAEPRRQAIRDVLHRGIQTGELRPDLDIDLTTQLLTTPILYQTQVRGQPTPPNLPTDIVDLLIEGIRPQPLLKH
ncbi:MAG: TetR/AcrR family transcriptional regulator [Solirubrobacteraceae bacterium]